MGTATTHDNKRVIIEAITPQIDGGHFPVKRVVGDVVRVEADAFADGHDVIVCQLLHRYADEKTWHQSTMRALGNDRWQGEFRVEQMGRYAYTVVAWRPIASWTPVRSKIAPRPPGSMIVARCSPAARRP